MRAACFARGLCAALVLGLLLCTLAAHASRGLPDGYTLERARFGAQMRAPAGLRQPAWTTDVRAGAELMIHTHGIARIRMRGPKCLGGSWNTIWDLPVPASGELRFKAPRHGRYGLFATPRANTEVGLKLACGNPPCAPPAWPLELPRSALRLIMVGDTGLQPHRAPADPYGGFKYEEYHLFTEMLEGFEHYLDHGDLNFANLETAVTSRGRAADKRHTFRMHRNALNTLVRAGFNAFAMANNHAGDYGLNGLLDGLHALREARRLAPQFGHAGTGESYDEALAPHVFEQAGVRVAFASAGFGFGFERDGPYMAELADLDALLLRLLATPADLRVLGVHFGWERKLAPNVDARALAHKIIDAGVDVLWGHHPHVAQGIERRGDGLILYSVGNFLLRGARNMGSLGADMDYGLAVRLAFDKTARRVTSLEVVPLYDMHRVVVPLEPDAARERIERLNRRSLSLGSGGVTFEVHAPTGAGVAHF